MGNQPSRTPQADKCPMENKNSLADKCRLEKRNGSSDKCPMEKKNGSSDKCPMEKSNRSVVYNVYSEQIDPNNNMPTNPNQSPHDEQRYPLESSRVASTIPKGGVSGTWTYPSEQMFYNAMKRKGKGEDVHEGNVPAIISIHNNMNEKTWKQVLEWEETCHPGSNPRLLRFLGRPDTLTPLARMKVLLGFDKPFDRHDWYVVRDSGEEVRYVIDYYYDEGKSKMDKVPSLHAVDSIRSISMYARPAVDSWSAAVDRIKMKFMQPAKVAMPKEEHHENGPTKSEVLKVQNTFKMIQEKCAPKFQALRSCKNEMECTQAAMALQTCMGSIVCPSETKILQSHLSKAKEEDIEKAYNNLLSCLEKYEQSSKSVLRQEAIQKTIE